MIISKTEPTIEDYTALNEKVLDHQLSENYPLIYPQSKSEFDGYVKALPDDNIYYKVHQDDVESYHLILENGTIGNIPVNEKYMLFYIAESIDDKNYVVSQYVVLRKDFNIKMINSTLDNMSEEILKYT